MRRKSWFLGTVALYSCVGLVASSCRSGGDSQPQWYNPVETKSLKVGRVMAQVVFEVPENFKDSLTPQQLSELVRRGYRIEGNRLVYPLRTLEGHRVKIGGKYIPVGADGVFEVPANLATRGVVELYNQIDDDEPLARFSIADFVDYGSSPKTTVVDIKVPIGNIRLMSNPDSTNGRSGTDRGEVEECKITVNTLDEGCCEDYLGPLTDGKNYRNVESPDAIINFIGSTCANWVAEGVCPLYFETVRGRGCFRQHKGRWCQFLNKNSCAATVNGANPTYYELHPGETLQFLIWNNTPSNSTQIDFRIEPFGDYSGQQLFTLAPQSVQDGSIVLIGPETYSLRHYVDGNPPKYSENLFLVFTAPNLPPQQKEVLITIRFSWWLKSKEQVVRVKVINPECE